mmetsp:Transcript_17203/g.49926  ORF Transcript_17203/g.49926 Transcript_17203/m.49926 type:complete len:205 (-) Transcript_17203:506-1120(-)
MRPAPHGYSALGTALMAFILNTVCLTFSPACTSLARSSLPSSICHSLTTPPVPTTTGIERKVSSSMPGTWPRTLTERGSTSRVSARMLWMMWRIVKPMDWDVQPRTLMICSKPWLTSVCMATISSRFRRRVSCEPPHMALSMAAISTPLCSPITCRCTCAGRTPSALATFHLRRAVSQKVPEPMTRPGGNLRSWLMYCVAASLG